MGVSVTFQTMFGIRIPKVIKWDEDLFYSTDPAIPNIEWLGMDSKEHILGVELFSSGSDRWGWEDYQGDLCLDIDSLPIVEKKYKEQFRKYYPQYAYLMDEKFLLHTFMNCR